MRIYLHLETYVKHNFDGLINSQHEPTQLFRKYMRYLQNR